MTESATPRSSETCGLVWDFEDRLAAASSGGITAEYVYDHAGARVAKYVRRAGAEGGAPEASAATYPSRFYEIRDGAPVKHVFAGERRVATIIDAGRGPQLRHVHEDHLGSTHVVTDETGGILEEMDYYPYGHPRPRRENSSPGATEPYKFLQKELDEETGMQYLGARYFYGPLGRFPDRRSRRAGASSGGRSRNPQRLNAYSYSLNRPADLPGSGRTGTHLGSRDGRSERGGADELDLEIHGRRHFGKATDGRNRVDRRRSPRRWNSCERAPPEPGNF